MRGFSLIWLRVSVCFCLGLELEFREAWELYFEDCLTVLEKGFLITNLVLELLRTDAAKLGLVFVAKLRLI